MEKIIRRYLMPKVPKCNLCNDSCDGKSTISFKDVKGVKVCKRCFNLYLESNYEKLFFEMLNNIARLKLISEEK